jgi:hypothetical protein
MSQASSWSDYYDFKDMREDAFCRHDISVGWHTVVPNCP